MMNDGQSQHPSVSGFVRRIAAACAVIAAALMAAISPVRAHPHVWVVVESTILFENGAITGFRHKWTFDEYYTAMAIEGLDTNKDGIYSREELAELAKVNIEGLKEFGYFTFPRLAGQELALDAPKDFWLELAVGPATAPGAPATGQPAKPADSGILSRLQSYVKGDKAAEPAGPAKLLTLNFTLPLKQPVLAEAPDFSVSIGDTSYFIAFEMAPDTPIKLGAGAPAGCKIDLGSDTPEAAASQRLGDVLSKELGSGAPAPSIGTSGIRLNCAPKS